MSVDLSKGLFSVDQLSINDIKNILNRAAFYKKRFQTSKNKKVGTLNGRTMINMFYEPSTRTRISFEQAAKRMGMVVSDMNANTSAMVKGETIIDTIKTLDAMRFDIVAIRTSENNLPFELSHHTNSSAIINAGDGTNEHPTQALIDLFTIKEQKKIKTIAIVGDLIHSRVAKSNTKLLKKMGYNIILCGPENWLPTLIDWNIKNINTTNDLSEVIDCADIIMTLRIQKERFNNEENQKINLDEYISKYSIKNDTLKKDQLLMHPGPVNKEIELSTEVTYGANSLILNQVENGIAVRCSILEYILNRKD